MGLMQGGANVIPASEYLKGQDVLWNPAKTGPSYAVVLDDPEKESLVGMWVGCFQNGGMPLNASWLYAGAEDPANILGIKVQQYVWVWVAVLDGGRLTPKLYSMPAARYAQLKSLDSDWGAMGLVIKVQKEGRAWTIQNTKLPTNMSAYGPGRDNMHISDEALSSLRDGCIRDNVKLAQMLGPVDDEGSPSVDGIWKMLLRRAEKATSGKVTTKAGIVKLFGKDPAEFGIEDEDGLADF